MANLSGSLNLILIDRHKIEEHLECPICTEVITNCHQLPCFHSYCLRCLEDHMRANEQPRCPQCNRQYNSTNIAKNYILDAVIQSLRASLANASALESQPSNRLIQEKICKAFQDEELGICHGCRMVHLKGDLNLCSTSMDKNNVNMVLRNFGWNIDQGNTLLNNYSAETDHPQMPSLSVSRRDNTSVLFCKPCLKQRIYEMQEIISGTMVEISGMVNDLNIMAESNLLKLSLVTSSDSIQDSIVALKQELDVFMVDSHQLALAQNPADKFVNEIMSLADQGRMITESPMEVSLNNDFSQLSLIQRAIAAFHSQYHALLNKINDQEADSQEKKFSLLKKLLDDHYKQPDSNSCTSDLVDFTSNASTCNLIDFNAIENHQEPDNQIMLQ